MNHKRLTKKDYKLIHKKLCKEKKSVWKQLKKRERDEVFKFSEEYKAFLSEAKTEREAVEIIRQAAIDNGFKETETISGTPTRILWSFRGKAAALAVIGKRPLENGVRLIASHIDAPRLDLKQNPLYEELEMGYLKTHYYGGIKKFHWVARPLAIHGVAIKSDGTTVPVTIGEKDGDPVMTINDILPHLAYNVQADKKISQAIPAEKLNVLVGGIPLLGPEDAKNGIKLNILKILNDRYGLIEEDLISAEIEIVPAGRAQDVGLDRSFVGGYGQDDRSCAYASLKAILEQDKPEHTAIALFLDKEEIGSDGNTGAKSRFLELILYDLMRLTETSLAPDTLIRTFIESKAISADVTAGIDPDYQEVHEKRNDALIGHGICVTKYTGSRGKYSANDAHAEYVGWLRNIFNEANIIWQAGELGRVDEGGGGTVAKYLSQHGIDTIDAGPPLLSMHSPFEIAHKADLYMTYRAYKTFYQKGTKGGA